MTGSRPEVRVTLTNYNGELGNTFGSRISVAQLKEDLVTMNTANIRIPSRGDSTPAGKVLAVLNGEDPYVLTYTKHDPSGPMVVLRRIITGDSMPSVPIVIPSGKPIFYYVPDEPSA